MKPLAAIRIQRFFFTVLCLAVIALLVILSRQYPVSFDWTGSSRNSLSATSRKVLDTLPGPIRITGFAATGSTLRGAMVQLVARYQRYRGDIRLELVNPQTQPALAEQYAVQTEGELVIDYRGRRENVRRLAETTLSTALSRLARGADRWVMVLDGYSNRNFYGGTRTDLGQLSKHLEGLGLKLRKLDLTDSDSIPDNISLLVIPQLTSVLPDREVNIISTYLEGGGNLLWFADPGSGGRLAAIADKLGVRVEPGMLVDPNSRIAGKSAPEFIQVNGYADHPVSAGLETGSVFPTAASLNWQAPAGWRVRGIAASPLNSWRETGDLSAAVRFDEGRDSLGPADIAVAMQRPGLGGKAEQRVFIVGDSDFASNAYLGLGANRALASNIFNWLSDDDALLNLPTITADDLNFNPQPLPKAIIVLGAPIILPALLFGFGLYRWQRRRRS